MFLDAQREDDRRECGNHCRDGELSVMRRIRSEELRDRHGDGLYVGSCQKQRECKFIPCKDEGQKGRRNETRFNQRDQILEEDLPPCITVHLGRILDFHGDILEVAADNPDQKRHGDQLVNPDQAEICIINAKLLVDHEQRQHDQDFRSKLEGKNLERDVLFLPEVVSGQRVRSRDTDDNGNDNRKSRYDQGIQQIPRIRCREEYDPVILERRCKNKHGVVHLRIGLKGQNDHPDKREQRKYRIQDKQYIQKNFCT